VSSALLAHRAGSTDSLGGFRVTIIYEVEVRLSTGAVDRPRRRLEIAHEGPEVPALTADGPEELAAGYR
jgi:hypothetical protein